LVCLLVLLISKSCTILFWDVYVGLKVQLLYVYFIPLYLCSTCFGCYLHPSSGTQTAAYSHWYV
jgi:hypothetical protein